jgi:DNA-binding transcriptional ArsR family regulator
MGKPKPQGTFVIKDRDTLKVVADPLRTQILETMVGEPQTVKQVAGKLGLAPSKLYYHFGLLEKHGLIEVVETRAVANMTEKLYQATASDLRMEDGLLTVATDEGRDVFHTVIQSTIDTTRDDLLRSLQARYFQLEQGAPENPRHVMLTREVSYLPKEKAEELMERMKVIIQEFKESEVSPKDEGAMPYAVMVAFYPSFYFAEQQDRS